MTLDTTLARVRADIDALRAEASDHTRAAARLGDQITSPRDHLDALARREGDLRADLEALRMEMVDVRRRVDGLTAQRDTHVRAAKQATAAADHYQQVTLPHVAALLDAPPPHEALAATSLMPEQPEPEPGQLTLHAATASLDCCPAGCHPDEPTEDDLTAPGVIDSRHQVAALTAAGPPADPAMTMPDLDPVEPLPPADTSGEPGRHARPPRRSGVTGAWHAITGRLGSDQDGDTDE